MKEIPFIKAEIIYTCICPHCNIKMNKVIKAKKFNFKVVEFYSPCDNCFEYYHVSFIEGITDKDIKLGNN